MLLEQPSENYVSWFLDPYALNVNSFSFDWKYNPHYISTHLFCLQKIKLDGADALVIAPLWPTQIWFTPLMDMLIDQPRILSNSKTLLTLPGQSQTHPMFPKLKLLAWRLSGNRAKATDIIIVMDNSTQKQYQVYIRILRTIQVILG